MISKRIVALLTVMMILSLSLSACQEKPEVVGGFEIPVIEKGKFNVAMVLIGPTTMVAGARRTLRAWSTSRKT